MIQYIHSNIYKLFFKFEELTNIVIMLAHEIYNNTRTTL